MTKAAKALAPGIGLRWRIAALSALIAVLSVSLCGLVAARAVRAGLAEQHASERERVTDSVERQIERLAERIGYEVGDYAGWSEFYEQMPQPDRFWVEENMVAGSPGSLVTYFVVVANDRIVGRFHRGKWYDANPRPEDPALPQDLLALASTQPRQGLARCSNNIALVASRPILRNDGSGPPAGVLIGMTYASGLEKFFFIDGWSLSFSDADLPSPGSASRLVMPALDGGGIHIGLVPKTVSPDAIAVRTIDAIAVGGLVCVIISMLLGMLLGVHWLRPLSALARAARRRVEHPDEPLPDPDGLREAADLRQALEAYAEAERRHREALATALDREAVANTVHRRFLAQLAHEIGAPIERIVVVFENLAKGIAVDGEILARVRLDALRLEERVHEALGLAAEIHDQSQRDGITQDLSAYLDSVVDALQPLAERLRRELTTDADPGTLSIQVALLTPILVNLAANSLRAQGKGPVILSVRVMPDDSTVWRVSDPGPGMGEELSAVVRDAFTRGEVVPGTLGIGLGLAVAISNARALKAHLTLERSGPGGTTIALEVPSQGSGIDYRAISSGTARFRRRGEM